MIYWSDTEMIAKLKLQHRVIVLENRCNETVAQEKDLRKGIKKGTTYDKFLVQWYNCLLLLPAYNPHRLPVWQSSSLLCCPRAGYTCYAWLCAIQKCSSMIRTYFTETNIGLLYSLNRIITISIHQMLTPLHRLLPERQRTLWNLETQSRKSKHNANGNQILCQWNDFKFPRNMNNTE